MTKKNHNLVYENMTHPAAQVNVVPVHSVELISELAGLLVEEGYPILEILGRPMEAAVELLKAFNERPERSTIQIAVGTIRTRRHAEQAAALKPDLMVSPAFSRHILDVAVEADIAYLPAVSTLQDIQNILEAYAEVGRELKVLKVCPVKIVTMEIAQMYANIFPGIVFCPTGTIEIEALSAWKANPWMGVAMEQWFVPTEVIQARDWDTARASLRKIKALAAEGVAQRKTG